MLTGLTEILYESPFFEEVLKNLNRLLIYQYKQITIIDNYLFIVLLSMLDNYAKTNYRKYMYDVANFNRRSSLFNFFTCTDAKSELCLMFPFL